ncbi:hypothetical protein H4R18_001679 [Coemansia javaensis]|uniref:Non-specific serine/threonine protein kinase n=1 Tax=Coemansia javaensis TaxID=2761396 RepID=A0A9W8LL71_9FUNG|nr:hypothetical protein H4R18_001679 [Coemansia javaensis]
MSASPFGGLVSTTDPGGTLSSRMSDSDDSGSEVDLRRVQIQAIPHSMINADALVRGRAGAQPAATVATVAAAATAAIAPAAHSSAAAAAAAANDDDTNNNNDSDDDDDDNDDTGGEQGGAGGCSDGDLPYGLPSAANGRPLGLRSTPSFPGREAGHLGEQRKASGLRAALASKFAAKKKPKDLRASVAVNTKRQQHQLESLLSQSEGGGRDSSSGPMVGGQPVGHPMSFQHVEHLSPTDVGPKMPLINGCLERAALEAPAAAKGAAAPSERRLKFRNFKPAALLTKSSKASIGSGSSGDGDKPAGLTVRGKPIGAPMGFHHVEHMSPTEYSMQQFHLLNHRQQQAEIVSVLRQNSQSSGERPRTRAPSVGARRDRRDKVTLRGLPVSGPVSFEHVEHVSPRDYRRHIEETARAATNAAYDPENDNDYDYDNNNDDDNNKNDDDDEEDEDCLPPAEPAAPSAPPMVRAASTQSAGAPASPRPGRSDNSDNNANADAASTASRSSDASAPERPRIAALQHTSQSVRTAASAAGLAKPPKANKAMLRDLQARARQAPPGDGSAKALTSTTALPRPAMLHPASHPLLFGLLARAGVAKVKEISSPFNVQHDVHISVEDLDDFMQQVPETWKPYISPRWSPQSEHRLSETQDPATTTATATVSQPRTPIYEEMTAHRRRSAESDDILATQLSRARLGASSDSAGPSTPGWLPHIVSVASPASQSPLALRKTRTASGLSAGALGSIAGAAAAASTPHVPATGGSSSSGGGGGGPASPTPADAAAEPRAPTPVSAPIRAGVADDARAGHAAAAVAHAPGTPQSVSARTAPTSWDQRDADDGERDRAQPSGRAHAAAAAAAAAVQASEELVPEEPHAKWIKRKSRAVSTLSMAKMSKHMSRAVPSAPVPVLSPEAEKRHTLSPESTGSAAARAKAAAIARLEMNAVRPMTGSLPPDSALAASAAAAAAAAASGGRHSRKTSGQRGNGGGNGGGGSSSTDQRPGTVSSKSSEKRRENYGELEEYAEGESGNVFITARKATAGKRVRGEHVAVKVVPKTAKARYRKLRTELKILRRIRSQHVVRFYEYFSIDDSVWIVYEFMGRGSITDLLAGYPEIRMPAITISFAMHEVLTALAYLHERHIIHGDVRSDNVLIDDKGQVKLADFSNAVFLDAGQTSAQKASLGAIYWLAPELAKGAGYSASTDVWAAGALLFEMLEGQPPYIEYPDIKVLELAHANGMPKPSAPGGCDPSLVALMRQCTAIAPADRPSAARLRKHESVSGLETSQCTRLMIDFVLQVESLEADNDDADSVVAP